MRARMKPNPLPLQQTTADESAKIYTLVLELQIIKVVVDLQVLGESDLQILLRT
jgi:hypothetical protein